MVFIGKFVPIRKNRVVIVNEAGLSGSNPLAFAELLQQYTNYEVVILNDFPSMHHAWKKWLSLASGHYLVYSHDPLKVKSNQRVIELWHGIPLKRMGYLAKNSNQKDAERMHRHWLKSVDYIVSPSPLYATLMSACLGLSSKKFVPGQLPRNYCLKAQSSRDQYYDQLLSLFPQEVREDRPRILFYMPTFRNELNDKLITDKINNGNYLAFTDFDDSDFNKYLSENNFVWINKLHPIEAKMVRKSAKSSRIVQLDNKFLKENQTDLYHYLNQADVLITDYSSVYFDFLLTEKPIIFITNTLSDYEAKRGFLLEPYTNFTPGEHVKNYTELKDAILLLIDQPQKGKSKRDELRRMMFQDVENNPKLAINKIMNTISDK